MIKDQIAENLPKGLLNWYPWKKGALAICMGEGARIFQEELSLHGIKVVSFDEATKVDYIIGIGAVEQSESPVQLLKNWKEKLNTTGHLFLGVENRLGLRYFCGDQDSYTKHNFDGIENYRNMVAVDQNYIRGRNYARFEWEQLLSEAEIRDRRFYSVLPGLEMPQQMYAEDFLPQEDLTVRYTPLYHSPQTVFLDETRMYTDIIQNGMFHQMANAYLIDCSMDGQYYEWNHVTVSMDRGREDAFATIIQKDNVVEKKVLYPEGKYKIQQLMEYMQRLMDHGIDVVPMKINQGGDGVRMPYMDCMTALTYFQELIQTDPELFKREVERFLDLILQSSERIDSGDKNEELGMYYKEVYIDMVPLNCFYQNGTFLFFDQEFCEFCYPINVTLIRALDLIYLQKQMEELVPKSYFLKKYGLEEKINVYRDMGRKYIEKLRNKEALVSFNQKYLADISMSHDNRQRMNYTTEEYRHIFLEYMKDVKEKGLYIFGTGLWARKFIAEYAERYTIQGALDNKKEKWGEKIDQIPIISPDELRSKDLKKCKIIICIKYFTSVVMQLKELGVRDYGVYDPNIEPIGIEKVSLPIVQENTVIEQQTKKYQVGYIAGVFDLFHIGHLNLLRRAKEQCSFLLVGVVSDEQASAGKSRSPYISESERLQIVQACKYVDQAFLLPVYASGTRDVYKKYHFDVQFSGSDYEHDPNWLDEQEWLRNHGADMVFFPYTKSTSSTKIKQKINE